jgi:hypothetical protein
MSEINGRRHAYHAEASVLEGLLELPLQQKIHPQAYATLPEEGGYLSQRSEDFRLESVLSYRTAYTQVAGNHDVKPGHGWATLTTSVVEGLNVLDVLTADRVVCQISTEHPLDGYVPTVSFLGSRFENLRIGGHLVEVDLDLNILGDRPAADTAYTKEPGLIDRVTTQYRRIREARELPPDLGERYNRLSSSLGSPEAVECSLVNRADGGYPGQCYGHMLTVPNFGRITLGKVTLHHDEFKTGTNIPKKTTVGLTMIHMKFGCAIAGSAGIAALSTNGMTRP